MTSDHTFVVPSGKIPAATKQPTNAEVQGFADDDTDVVRYSVDGLLLQSEVRSPFLSRWNTISENSIKVSLLDTSSPSELKA
jgi:hypothetical protein